MIAALAVTILATQALASQDDNQHNTRPYQPTAFHIGPTSPEAPSNFNAYRVGSSLRLTPSSPVLTLDYGAEVAGFPYFTVQSLTGPTQVELKYSEPYDGLQLPYSDGPFLFVNGLMNSFRTETFNLTAPGRVQSSLAQGGQRWQTIKLLTNSSIILTDVGFVPTVDIEPTVHLPGALSTSSQDLNKVWDLGARSVQAACVEPYSQPSTWDITIEGALIRGQYPGTSAKGLSFGNYSLTFFTKIVQGGTGWRVAASANAGYGAYFVLTTSGPHLANTNSTLLPSNTLIAGFGFSIIDQAILASAPPQYYKVPFEISQDRWYRITTTISAAGYNISVNGTQIAFVDLQSFEDYINAGWGNPQATDGTWGFGPFQDQAAYFRDVVVTASDGKAQLYSDPLTNEHVLAEYRVATNSDQVCLDGAKRDRLIWIGDFAHTARMLAATTGYEYIRSMIEYEFRWQLTSGPGAGLVPMQEAMGDAFQFRSEYYPSQYGENDYEIFFLLIVGDYFALTEDTPFMREHWTGLKILVETLIERFLDPASGLLADPNGVLWFTAQGAQNATAPTALFVVALQELIPIARALREYASVKTWSDLVDSISTKINQKLWSDDLGTYIFALDDPGNYSLLSAAFPIRAGIANTSQATRSIQSLSNLFLNIGYKDSTRIGNSNTTQLSPNVQGFLLESLFVAHTNLNVSADVITPVIKNLLEVYWPHMVNQNEYSTGCPWEYMYPDGSPGIGIFTSLCHPWGGAPTYILSNYFLGIRRESKDLGSYEWVLDPVWEVVKSLGVKQASGRMPLPEGGWIEARWSLQPRGRTQCEAFVHGARNVHVNAKGPCRMVRNWS
ncbi:glycoside hydrolase family 78 protein [Zasmidium cellare ATCC 36951]|uniref:Glycoside hydrolase family 78 protein n=1 Tax=Zasmidium cellare ATCC 36951 TaxID=1080233 RepID=A0A6A6CBN0_ZASCE|nr:glycoside hydrolase family 78 protein [Zasmidium cellare ATCC 36951]KAF2164441.1 glycoside hydrolase family 78 protein [Zasmidium cellare ATCC 36951]